MVVEAGALKTNQEWALTQTFSSKVLPWRFHGREFLVFGVICPKTKGFRKSFRKRSAFAKASTSFRAHSGNRFSEVVAGGFPKSFPYLYNFVLAPVHLTALLSLENATQHCGARCAPYGKPEDASDTPGCRYCSEYPTSWCSAGFLPVCWEGSNGIAACMANTASQGSILGVHYTRPDWEKRSVTVRKH